MRIFAKLKNFLLELFFPKSCLGCGREGKYLCEDCCSIIEILEYQFCPGCQKRVINGETCRGCKEFIKLNGLYFAAPYQDYLVKKIISQFKYQPFIKELAKPLASLIITHFLILDKEFSDSEFLIIPIPLDRKRLKWRGFNQAAEIAILLSKSLKIPVLKDALIKIKETLPQVEIEDKEERKENILGVFLCQNQEKIKGRKILLVDDVYTTGATMNEGARVLKESGAKEVWGTAVARG
ncbi:ComF family protein [Patescibacteria group bacterium]|nr:ComF family protein [Patescibacteria group bacterium]